MNAGGIVGRRILLTRAREESYQWAFQLAARGAIPVVIPCVRTERVSSDDARSRLVAANETADWLVLGSPRGVDALAAARIPWRPEVRVAAVGPSTANAVRRALAVEPFVSQGATSASLGAELVQLIGSRIAQTHLVVIAAEHGRTDADDALRAAGARVTRVELYRTIPTAPLGSRRDLRDEGIEAVLLASPSAVTGLLAQAEVGSGIPVFTIGPTTTAAAAAAGLTVRAEARRPDLDGLLEAMRCALATP